jgi:hypothetical protein
VLGMLIAALFLGSSMLLANKVVPEVGGVSISGAIGYVLSFILGYRMLRVIGKDDDADKKK